MAPSDEPETESVLRERVAARDALIDELRRQIAERDEGSPAGREARTDRIEMFSDGVFAIALTLLVLDLRIPPRDQLAGRDLWSALGDRWTGYVSFALSFIIVAVVWANHRTMFAYIRRADHGLVVLNTLLLLDIALLPFCAGLLGEYIDAPRERQAALLIYTGTLVWGGVAFNALWRYAARDRRLLDPAADPQVVRTLSRRYMLGPLLYAVAFALSLLNGVAGLTVCGALALLYLLPGFTHHVRSDGRRSPDRSGVR